MYFISINFLNKALKQAIESKSISPEELKDVSARMREKAKKDTKLIAIIIACFVALILVFGAISFGKEGNTEAILPVVLSMIPGGAFIFGFVWLLQVGIVKMQFNSAVKKYYPEIAGELKI